MAPRSLYTREESHAPALICNRNNCHPFVHSSIYYQLAIQGTHSELQPHVRAIFLESKSNSMELWVLGFQVSFGEPRASTVLISRQKLSSTCQSVGIPGFLFSPPLLHNVITSSRSSTQLCAACRCFTSPPYLKLGRTLTSVVPAMSP